MIVARTLAALRAARHDARGPVGLVPTMGYLHQGHLSLVHAAKVECASVYASIFVNPTQFGPNEDFAKYPRDEARDLQMLDGAGVSLVFIPSVDEMYPAGDATRIAVEALTGVLEGARRPGHFVGVATVVAKLLNAVQPDRAYFGQKDAQQLAVIRRMVRDLLLPIEVVGCPIIRDEDGLACSSRNVYLSPEQRQAALSLSRGLRAAEHAFADGTRDAEVLRAIVRSEVAAEPLAAIDYISLADADTLAELDGVVRMPALLSLVVGFGPTHLLDNVTFAP